MAKDKTNNPSMGSNELRDETSERRGSGVIPVTDTATKMAALSAQKEKQAEEALAKAKQNVKNADIPARLPGDIQQQTR